MNTKTLLDCTIPFGAVLGAVITAQDIYTWLGIVILVFQIILVIYNSVIKIVNHIKEGRHQDAMDEIEELTRELQELEKKNKDE